METAGITWREVIERGYRELMQSAEKISDVQWCLSFLENVAENKAIVERWSEMRRS